jgi:cell division protein FtsB
MAPCRVAGRDVVSVVEPTREELEALLRELREEVARLKDEIRRLRHDQHEVPPHYL